MGLFRRARSLQQKPKRIGLLGLSRKIIARLKDRYPPITQAELDAIMALKPEESGAPISITSTENKRPAVVPLSWEDAGIALPLSSRGPSISADELDIVLGADKKLETENLLLQKIFSAIGHLQESIEAPAYLFRILKDHLNFSKAALLLYDPLRLVFAPWAIVGFDQTTHHRLRIPLGYNQSFNLIANGDVLIVSSDEELESFHRCFSSGDFAALDRIQFVPFIFNEKLIALLLVAGTGVELSTEHWEQIITRSAPVLFRAREEKMERLKQEFVDTADSIEEKAATLAKLALDRGHPFIMIRISLEAAVEKIIQDNPHLDPFRLKEDLSNLVHTLLSDAGKVYSLDRYLIMLFVYHLEEADTEFLLHHIELSLRFYFKELPAVIDFQEEIRIISEDDTLVPQVLSSLI